MFIELTDHLRCPADHDEAYLVLLPDVVERRDVIRGRLGCPVCGWETVFEDRIVDLGGAPAPRDGATTLSAEAVRAFLGLSGPGGYAALVGAPAALAEELSTALRGVSLVLVNPPAGTRATAPASIVRGARLPLKTGSMRGVVLGSDYARDGSWTEDAVRATLPGLRIVGEGESPTLAGLEILGSVAGVWVARKSQ